MIEDRPNIYVIYYGDPILPLQVGLTGYTLANIAADPQSAPPGVTELVVAIEIFQVSYVIITAIIIIARKQRSKNSGEILKNYSRR